MKESGNLVKKVTYKNPLAQAFGIVLRRHRDLAGKTSTDISDLIGIGASYYRLIESGTNNLHVSKALALVEAFDGKFSFDSISKLLMAISIMEAMGNSAHADGTHYAEGLKLAAEKMSEYDPEKLRPLFSPFQKYKLFDALKSKTQTAENIAEAIEHFKVDEVVDQFLVSYSDFGKSPSEIQKDYLIKFLHDIPTFYIQILSEIKDTLLRMPVKMGFESLWQWEELNKANFSTIIGVVKEHKYITSLENLKRYKYRYLWEPSFGDIKIIYLDNDKGPDEVYELFRTNLRLSLAESKDKALLETFDEKITKIKFKQCNPTEFDFDKLIMIDLENEASSSNQTDLTFNASWVYTLKNNSSIGILSYISPKDAMLTSSRSLKIDSTVFLVNHFDSIWKSISK